MFTSPWAESLEDEEFFKSTILEVGKVSYTQSNIFSDIFVAFTR